MQMSLQMVTRGEDTAISAWGSVLETPQCCTRTWRSRLNRARPGNASLPVYSHSWVAPLGASPDRRSVLSAAAAYCRTAQRFLLSLKQSCPPFGPASFLFHSLLEFPSFLPSWASDSRPCRDSLPQCCEAREGRLRVGECKGYFIVASSCGDENSKQNAGTNDFITESPRLLGNTLCGTVMGHKAIFFARKNTHGRVV